MANDTSVALTGSGRTHVNTVQVPPDRRLIILAQGKQFTDPELPKIWRVPSILLKSGPERKDVLENEMIASWKAWMNSRKPSSSASAKAKADWQKENAKLDAHIKEWRQNTLPLESHEKLTLVETPPGSGIWFYINRQQGVEFEIRRVTTKQAFVQPLADVDRTGLYTGVHVIYDGHARYGRGPCFGTPDINGETDAPGDEWEDGTGPHPNQTGIFRMGFPFIAVPVHEIFEHGYRGTLATDMTKFSKDTCDPDLWAEWKSKTHHKGTLAQMQRLISNRILKIADPPCPQCGTGKHSLISHIVDRNNNTPAASLEYPYYLDKTGELNIILDAGWKDTKSTPKDDWGSRPAVCKVFCHFGCSTERHNSRVIREFANWQQSGDSGYAYWTTDLSVGVTSLLWLQHLLSYDQPNAFKPWKDSLKYAFDKTNADLKNGKFKFLLSDGSKKK